MKLYSELSARKIRAAFVGRRGIPEIRAIDVPELEEGSVLVQMKSSGICGTDLEKLTGAYTASTVLGHEVAGVITDSRNSKFERGQRVVPHHHVACGSCFYCKLGAETMCNGFRTSNFVPGGFADEFKVPAYNVARGGLHRFDNISFDEASFAEPLGCCIRGLEKAIHAKLSINGPDGRNQTMPVSLANISSALVVGAGPIGLLHMELLRSRFQEIKIATVDINGARLDLAEKIERAAPIMPSKPEESFADEAMKLVDGLGYDLVVVATGNVGAFAESVKCVRKSGILLLFGTAHKGATYPLDLQSMLLTELSLTSSYATTETEISEAISLLESGKINVGKFITSRYPLERINEGMQIARNEGQVKVLITA